MSLFDVFSLISFLYVGLAILTLYRVVTRWQLLWDARVTDEDLRLARTAGFYLMIPPTVALHELGHAALIWANGLDVEDWQFLGFIGWVAHRPAGAIGDFAIALAGNVVTLLIGVGVTAFVLRRPRHPVWNTLWLELGRQSLFLVLAFYPLLCLAFDGDFRTIYNFKRTPIAAGITAAVHAAILIVGYNIVWKRRYRSRAALLASPVAAQLVEAERRLQRDPNDVAAHRELGLVLLAVSDAAGAVPHLRRAIDAGHVDAKTRLAYGRALAQVGDAANAIAHLEAARQGLLRPQERLLAELPLAESLIVVGQTDQARALLEELARAHPRSIEIRALLDRVTRS